MEPGPGLDRRAVVAKSLHAGASQRIPRLDRAVAYRALGHCAGDRHHTARPGEYRIIQPVGLPAAKISARLQGVAARNPDRRPQPVWRPASSFPISDAWSATRGPSPTTLPPARTSAIAAWRCWRELHKKDYERIIVVGHSLGSILAYDLISYFWANRPAARVVVQGSARIRRTQGDRKAALIDPTWPADTGGCGLSRGANEIHTFASPPSKACRWRRRPALADYRFHHAGIAVEPCRISDGEQQGRLEETQG